MVGAVAVCVGSLWGISEVLVGCLWGMSCIRSARQTGVCGCRLDEGWDGDGFDHGNVGGVVDVVIGGDVCGCRLRCWGQMSVAECVTGGR